jgi:pimeloyl-ACP methyl ester carboxylesterase
MELAYKRFGEGQPLLILHGLFGSSDNWMSFGKNIADKGFEVFLVDLRNHGNSGFDDSHTYEDMKKDLFTFCYHHEIKGPIVLGHSMGGKVGMFFAAGYPDVVSKLVVIDISPRTYELKDSSSITVNHAEIIDAMKNIDLESLKSRTQAQNQLMDIIQSKPVVQFLLKNLTRNDEKEFAWKLNLDVLKKDLPRIMKGLSEEDIKNKELLDELPALFIKGEKSNYIIEEDKDLVTNFFPHSEIVTIENAGHWVHAEKTDEVLKHVLRFVENDH